MSDGISDAYKDLTRKQHDGAVNKPHDPDLCLAQGCAKCREETIGRLSNNAEENYKRLIERYEIPEDDHVIVGKLELTEATKMNKHDYFKFHRECLEKMAKITAAKNADYTGVGTDPFANFTRVEALGICSTEQGFLTRMVDKIARITSFVQKGELQVKDESVEDTLLDLANYAILFAGYIKSKKGEQK